MAQGARFPRHSFYFFICFMHFVGFFFFVSMCISSFIIHFSLVPNTAAYGCHRRFSAALISLDDEIGLFE